jgi:hypothetical protein
MMMTEITCEMQCGDFADCALSECAGYETDSDRTALFDGCMDLCTDTPAIASIYAMYETCAEKMEFASGAREGFAALCAGGGASFCQRYSETCGEWTAETDCVEWYDAAAAGEAGATEGASQACYEYHLAAAGAGETEEEMMANATTHCPHIVGEGAMCVDAAAPSAEATAFCDTYTTVCGDWAGDTSCTDWFDAAPAGEEGATMGATQACYNYHLAAAGAGETPEEMMTNATTHCPHLIGESAMCID